MDSFYKLVGFLVHNNLHPLMKYQKAHLKKKEYSELRTFNISFHNARSGGIITLYRIMMEWMWIGCNSNASCVSAPANFAELCQHGFEPYFVRQYPLDLFSHSFLAVTLLLAFSN